MEKVIDALLKEYITDYINKKDYSFVVKDSIPIVWFGDIDAYEQSSTRIVTIGLNPSKEEFPARSNPRFESLDIETLKNSRASLAKTLNSYFKNNPYKKWFSKYNKLLNSMNASYGGIFDQDNKKENTAIHIDIYSAIATDPTWGKLSDVQKYRLENSALFDKLFLVLDPDIVLVSVNHQVFNNHFGKWKLIKERKFNGNNYIEIYTNGSKKLILGTNCRGTPFGAIKEDDATETIAKFINT